ncbi:MAG: hypothetical protein AAFN77_11905 [Planctomycetota bacterium]
MQEDLTNRAVGLAPNRYMQIAARRKPSGAVQEDLTNWTVGLAPNRYMQIAARRKPSGAEQEDLTNRAENPHLRPTYIVPAKQQHKTDQRQRYSGHNPPHREANSNHVPPVQRSRSKAKPTSHEIREMRIQF